MTEFDAILSAVDLLESRLCAPVKVAEAAEAACYSLFHFCRLFNLYSRQTPYEYLMRRRLSQASQDLAGGSRRILDIALDYQFTTSEGFARAFRRMFGVLPNQVRQGQAVEQRLCMPRLTHGYLEHLRCLHPVPRKERLPALTLTGWMTLCDHPALPATLHQLLKHETAGRLGGPGPLTVYGLLSYPTASPAPAAVYFAGVPTQALANLPASAVHKSLPEQTVVCFEHPGSIESLPMTLAYIFHTWLPHSQGPHLPDMLIQRFQLAAEPDAQPSRLQILIPRPEGATTS